MTPPLNTSHAQLLTPCLRFLVMAFNEQYLQLTMERLAGLLDSSHPRQTCCHGYRWLCHPCFKRPLPSLFPTHQTVCSTSSSSLAKARRWSCVVYRITIWTLLAHLAKPWPVGKDVFWPYFPRH
ncbi:hypothetical protein M378DRAFT_1042173 [Amanita muscaria Koide BX008]|uniref:Uncharacterized protein n=1 Tax=Amanita muscaria (strain Koide BX008) TaxID=946122 RepID=A0A0C2SNF1_AMAMK|nr:hypothetical protein M378DRAFT_1042173 [Amanita muscaria Koide BX008]